MNHTTFLEAISSLDLEEKIRAEASALSSRMDAQQRKIFLSDLTSISDLSRAQEAALTGMENAVVQAEHALAVSNRKQKSQKEQVEKNRGVQDISASIDQL